jgi:hypothetical protein
LFSAVASAADPGAPARAALGELQSWLKGQPAAKGWIDYLNLSGLETELGKGNDADPAVIRATIKQLDSGATGLDLTQFKQLGEALRPLPDDLVIATAPSLSEAALRSESNFRPISDTEVADAKTQLEAASKKLDRYLISIGTKGTPWREYLRWNDLKAQLEAKSPDAELLKAIQQRFAADQNGLEMPVFADVGAALESYVNVLAARADDVQSQYASHLKDLSEKIKQYEDAKLQSDEIAGAVGSDLGWLENMRQATALVRAIRNHYSSPNLFVEMSDRLFAIGVKQDVDETGPITDNILGTAISGTGHTVGHVDVKFVPNDQKAMFDTQLTGTTHTRTVGYNGPATISSEGTTQISGAKRIVIDANGFATYPATAAATTRTRITGVSAGGAMAQRVANDRVAESKPQAEQIAGSHAAARVRQRLDAQAAKQLGKSHADYLQKFRNPLVRLGEFPSLCNFSTTETSLFIKALQADRYQIAAPGEPPSLAATHDLAMRVHESAVNNLAAALLGGLTLKEKELQDKVIEWRGKLPEQLKSDADKDPWSITFAKSRPVTVKFTDEGVQIIIRGQRYTSGERDFRAMNVTADYKIKPSGASFKMVRDAELHIVPPNFAAGKTLSGPQVALKTLLQKKFGKLFEPEVKLETLTLSGRWEEAGPLDLKQLQSSGGWLVMAWLMSENPVTPADKVAQ